MMDYKICADCGEKVDVKANFCGNCKSTSFRSPNQVAPVAKTNQPNVIYSLFYWPYGGDYILSKSKLGAIVTFAVLFATAFTSPVVGGVILVAIVFAALFFLVGYLIHKLKGSPSRAKLEYNDYGLITDIKNLCFYWQNKNTGEFVLSKAKLISALIYIFFFGVSLATGAANFFVSLIVAAIFTAPAFVVGFIVHKLTNNNPTSNKPIKPRPEVKKVSKKTEKIETPPVIEEPEAIPQFEAYGMELDRLKSVYSKKEAHARELIEKKFTPPQITYSRFIAVIDKSTKLFNIEAEEIKNILNLASEDSPRIDREIKSKFEIMNSIIDKTDDLIDELVLSMDSKDDDVGDVIGDMEDLIGSIKEYE